MLIISIQSLYHCMAGARANPHQSMTNGRLRMSNIDWLDQVNASSQDCSIPQSWVKVQFRGPKLYKKEGALFQEESYLLRIFRFSSLNLHTFNLINIVFWWQFFQIISFWSTFQWIVFPRVHRTICCGVAQAIYHHFNWWWTSFKIISAKTLKLHSNWGHPSTILSPTCSWGIKIPGRYSSSWNSAPFFLKSQGPLYCTFTRSCAKP